MDSRLDLERSMIALEEDYQLALADLTRARYDLETLGLEKAELEADIVRLTAIICRLVETRKAAAVQPDDALVHADLAAAWAGAERWLAS